eukprot:COSAG02_NODE_107_length_36312_cov_45.037942_28_plen_87_part_00
MVCASGRADPSLSVCVVGGADSVSGSGSGLVQWENCSYLQSTFEPESNLAYAQQAVGAYHRKRRQINVDVSTAQLEDMRRLGRAIR